MVCDAGIQQSVICEEIIVPKYSSTNKQTLRLQPNNTPSEEKWRLSFEFHTKSGRFVSSVFAPLVINPFPIVPKFQENPPTLPFTARLVVSSL